jgi:hypothetical protein
MQTANIITSLFNNTSAPSENETMNVDEEKTSANSSVVIVEHVSRRALVVCCCMFCSFYLTGNCLLSY